MYFIELSGPFCSNRLNKSATRTLFVLKHLNNTALLPPDASVCPSNHQSVPLNKVSIGRMGSVPDATVGGLFSQYAKSPKLLKLHEKLSEAHSSNHSTLFLWNFQQNWCGIWWCVGVGVLG